MDTTSDYRWSIANIGSTTAHRSGSAANLTQAWTAALTAGRTGLLSGELDTLAVSVNGELEALHTPGFRADGSLDPGALTADLVEIHQGATEHKLAEQLAAQ
ncbi:MAG: hypothetical protein ACT4O0_08115 [Pseudonocardia sp.]